MLENVTSFLYKSHLIGKMAASKWKLLMNAGIQNVVLPILHKRNSFCSLVGLQKIYMSTVPNIQVSEEVANFRICRTSESDPNKHSLKHEALFYRLPNEQLMLFSPHTFNQLQKQQNNVFQETCFMIRRPALELIHYLKTANYNHPVIKYVLYGPNGFGKTVTLNHALHFCSYNGWLIINIPSMFRLLYCMKEIQTSSYNPNRIDLPLESVEWLKLFKQQNQILLQEKQFKTTKKYIWNKREFMDEGQTWEELIQHGINRVKYASDCIGALLREVRVQSATLGVKTIVAIDGVNAFFQESKVKGSDKQRIHAGNLSVVHAFKKILKSSWTKGAIIMTVDPKLKSIYLSSDLYLPKALLQKEGFEHLDPFVPICVGKYSIKEMESCLNFYIDKRLLQNEKAKSDLGRKELMFLSGGNGYTLSYLCSLY